MSKVEILCATMHQKDFQKIADMHIQSDVVFANQADECRYEEYAWGDYCARMVTTNTRGVGINRNIALMYAKGEYLLFSDDDLQYVEDYVQIIETAFAQIPGADCIVFNIETVGAEANRRENSKVRRVRWYNALNYGAVRMAVKQMSVQRDNIMFNRNFGGGTPFSCGEDTLYMVDMLKKGFKVYTYPKTIATVDQSSSTWFKGYNEKYYYDKGVLYASISRFWALMLCLQDLVRHPDYRAGDLTFGAAYKCMRNGVKNQKKMQPFGK